MQFGFISVRETTNALFVVRSIPENIETYVCFVDIEKTFDRVPRKMMELAMRGKVYQN